MEDSKSSSGLLLGLIIGAFITLMLFGRKSQPTGIVQHTSQRLDNQYDNQEFRWQPMDIPRVDDIKLQIVQPPIIRVQQDPKLIEMVSQLQKTSSQLEQTTSKLQELQEIVSRLKQDSISQPQQIIIQQPAIQQPVYQPLHVIVQQQPDGQPPQTNTQIQKPEIVQSPQPVQPIQPLQMTQPMHQQIYKNSEKWQIIRGKDGRIKFLDIVRNVKKSD